MKVKIEAKYNDATLDLCFDTLKKEKQAIVFVNTKQSAEKTAEEIAKKITNLKNKEKLEKLAKEVLSALPRPTKQCERLSECIKKGVAFHHAGLTHKQKEIIEDNFREGLIKIICATPTLAYGVDLPAFRVILKDLRRYSSRGLTFIPVLEYLQMSGRAGRPKFDSFGESIAIAKNRTMKKEIYNRYILGVPEIIYSKLALEPVLRIYLLSLIASKIINTEKEISDFFSKTFWAHQFKDMEKLKMNINKIIFLLKEWNFITAESEDFVSADNIKECSYKATRIGKRVSELYIDPLTAHNFIIALEKAKTKKINEFSFLQLISNTLEIRPLLSVRSKEYDKVINFLAQNEEFLLEKEPSVYDYNYDEFLNSIKTAMFFNDWINERDEEFLLETYSIRPGEIRVKIEIADWLLYSLEELAKLLKFINIISKIKKLRLRIKYGVKEELLPLLKLEGIGRVKARKLYNNGLKTILHLKKVDITKLVQLLGKNTAIKIKKQLGCEIKEIPERKRKGQVSLKRFKNE